MLCTQRNKLHSTSNVCYRTELGERCEVICVEMNLASQFCDDVISSAEASPLVRSELGILPLFIAWNIDREKIISLIVTEMTDQKEKSANKLSYME